MKGLSPSATLIRFGKGLDGWYQAQLAINDIPCIEFSIHGSQIEGLSEDRLGAMLERQAAGLIDRYGDARCPRIEPDLVEAT